MGFRERLKEEMAYQDIKTQDLAERSGVNKRTIDHYLMNNSQEPSVSKAVKIAQALHVSVEYLVTGTEAAGSPGIAREFVDFVNDFSALSPRQRSVVMQMVQVLSESSA